MNTYLANLFAGKTVAGKPQYSSDVVARFKKTVLKLQYADSIQELKQQRGLNFEGLRGKLKGYYSVRVDHSYRLILSIEKDTSLVITDILLVHDLTNHYR